MSKGNEYLEEAYEDLIRMSRDLSKRSQYEAREKALRDYRSNMKGAEERGLREGLREGRQEALLELCRDGILSLEEASKRAKMTVEEFRKLL